VSARSARLARGVIAFAVLVLCGLLVGSTASAATRALRPASVSKRAITFELHGAVARAIVSATLHSPIETRRVRQSDLRRAARLGVLRLRWRSTRMSAQRATRLVRSMRRSAILVLVTNTPAPAPAGPAPALSWTAAKPPSAPATSPSSPTPRVTSPPAPPPAPPGDVTQITGATYYVSSAGSDANDGRSPSAPWRTVAKVNSAALQPGDGVLFEGENTFSDSELSPSRSGTAGSRIVYGSYGGAHANLPQGIYLRNVNGLAFQNLSISGAGQGVLASGSGVGVSDVTLENLSISHVRIAINSANSADANWTIRNNSISQTGDSGLILYGTAFTVSANTISDTGTDGSIAYGKHAIYLKVIDARVTYNTITRPGSSGISVRYRNSVVEHNEINGGEDGIAWYQYDPLAGTSYWRHNTISNTTSAGIYVSPDDTGGPTRESFVITGNTVSKQSGAFLNLRTTTGTYVTFGNLLR